MGRHSLETQHTWFRDLTDARKPKARPDAHVPQAAVSFLNNQLRRKRVKEALSRHTQFTELERSRITAGGFSSKTKTSFSKNFTKFPTTAIPFSRPSHPRDAAKLLPPVNKEVIHLQTPLLNEGFQEKRVFKYSEAETRT